jgi:hypothetical protein
VDLCLILQLGTVPGQPLGTSSTLPPPSSAQRYRRGTVVDLCLLLELRTARQGTVGDLSLLLQLGDGPLPTVGDEFHAAASLLRTEVQARYSWGP